MLARAIGATPWGIEARPVQVEVDVRNGMPGMQIVGLADVAVRESRERVRAAIRNCGYELPHRAVTINLAPADIRKAGNHLDLAIAFGLLAAHGLIVADWLPSLLLAGELGLDGSVRPIRGGLAMAELAATLGVRELVLPKESCREAAAHPTVRVIPVESLAQAIEHFVGRRRLSAVPAPVDDEVVEVGSQPNMADVRGQENAKRALEIAAAGGHNVLFVGPPGSGKTMLARRLPGLLPPLTSAESVEVTKIHSIAGRTPPDGLVRIRPFRSPHAGISGAAMVGGGSVPRPGEITLAHMGVLFLDELPEFRRDALEGLRQPLEEGRVTIVRAQARFTFPARFGLLAAMNPCPCGHLGDPRHECGCSPAAIERYRGRVSGPLLDRIDLHVEVPALKLSEYKGDGGEPSEAVAERVRAARASQRHRFEDAAIRLNSTMTGGAVRKLVRLDAAAQDLLDSAFEKLGLSARAATRVLKVARTIADLAGAERVAAAHVAEAVQYRSLLGSSAR